MAVARPSSGGVVICTSGFMDDVMFAHKPRLLDVAVQLNTQLKRSAHTSKALRQAMESAGREIAHAGDCLERARRGF